MTVLLWLAVYVVGLTGYVLAHRVMWRFNAAADKAAREWVEARKRIQDAARHSSLYRDWYFAVYDREYPFTPEPVATFNPLIPYVAPNGERVLSDAEQAAMIAEIGL